ncbi:hypothetical protein OH77DRAFT_1427393 [Trametes cingulata]|nr:hypothetical protein OH77DRAFT_1427393 [Trametes cingulata]
MRRTSSATSALATYATATSNTPHTETQDIVARVLDRDHLTSDMSTVVKEVGLRFRQLAARVRIGECDLYCARECHRRGGLSFHLSTINAEKALQQMLQGDQACAFLCTQRSRASQGMQAEGLPTTQCAWVECSIQEVGMTRIDT